MRTEELQKKYPEFFQNIRTCVHEDIINIFNKDKQFLKYCDNPKTRKKLEIIAFNAAAFATFEHNKVMKIIKKSGTTLK